ncbi:uncharacterized protein [Onthophagus taurus]|uniref:uncharacterized protein isoform X1 n=2 Tax=Onthophagus taurus TaxID=166361 RepID=UPI0039BE7182
MSDTDDTWEEFFGPSTELMPGILSALDRILDKSKPDEDHQSTQEDRKPLASPRRIQKSNNFALSFNVQKILSNVDQETVNPSEDTQLKRNTPRYGSKRFLSDKVVYKSNENLEIIPSVQKMLSNLPDADLVIPAAEKKVQRNNSFLHAAKCEDRTNEVVENGACHDLRQCSVEKINGENATKKCVEGGNEGKNRNGYDEDTITGLKSDIGEGFSTLPSKPLGNYKHTSPSGIASRTPVGRKNMGKYLQVPSESSVGTNSTTSSEVSRPVSLTSLGSCSSSGSSGPHLPGSVYQASAESLDSDPEPSGIQGSADSGIAEDPSTNFNRKEHDVVAEIIDTETKYVEDLHKVIQDYLQPWKSNPDCYLHDYIPKLFSNLEDIYEFNSSFLEQLREAKLDPSATAKVFINNTGFSIYTDYCTDYPKTISVLTELMGNDESAKYFKEVQMEKHHDLPLGSYLLKPVQRILRYRMLLERLSERCESDHKPVVDLALTTMTGVAAHINNMKRKHEIAIRIQEIQSQLYGWSGPDLTTLGELIAEGTFRVGGVKGRRHVFLFDKLLLMTKCKQDGNFTYKSHIMCSNLMLVEQVRGEPLSFHVLPFDNPRLQVTLRAKSLQHKREWTGQLKRVIIENYNAAIPNHAQQLLMQLGQDLPEKEETPEMWTPLKKQYSTPHYLERRSRVRQSRDLSSRRAASHDRSFPSLGNWRRKSEPNVVQQYDNKTVPSRISKLKKAKESTSTFYTDLSDSETCEINDVHLEIAEDGSDYSQTSINTTNTQQEGNESIENLVTGIIMEHEEFNKVMNRKKRVLRESETDPNICLKQDKDPVTSKADSLPRSFQLNDQIDGPGNVSGRCIKNTDVILEPEASISTQLDNNDHPEHKIYRKSTIRLSLIQKYHAIKERHRRSSSKQASKAAIGARIANPDYEDPQKIFASMNSLNQSTISIASSKTESEDIDFEAPEELDMTINEHEVLTEFDRRLRENECSRFSCTVTAVSSQSITEISTILSHNSNTVTRSSSEILNSSQNSDDSYYESILEKNLNDDNVERCDSFRVSGASRPEFLKKNIVRCSSTNNSPLFERKSLQRPTKAPPPIPAKPLKFTTNTELTNQSTLKSTNTIKSNFLESTATTESFLNGNSRRSQSKGWVKTVVGRFE